ncbi:MAG: hypothetical protein GC150_07200 [Rhizobiales bacterium]|nr:hypothetical protein [Hyphomicrobiales bacterium]
MSWSLIFSPIVPWPVLYAAAAVVAVVCVLVLWRARAGALLRVLALLALLGALANPTLSQEERETLTNIAVVVTDESTSQRLDGRAERATAIRDELAARMARIPNLETRFVAAGSESPDETKLFGALEQALSSVPTDRLAGVVFVTDGQIHDVPATAQALGPDVPVHALITGRKGEFDRRIGIVKAPRYGIVGSEADVEFAIVVEGEGRLAEAARSAPSRIRVRRQGGPDQFLMARPGQRIRLPFAFPRAGKNLMELELESAEGELTEANNRAVIEAEGVRENLRVLLVSGEPHAGERTWRNLLKSDAAVDLVHFTILRPPEKQDGTPIHQLSLIAFPTRELFSEKLDEFDLIIFDRYQRRGVLPVLYIDNIARYVSERGGAVLVAAGTDYVDHLSLYRTPLRQILPAAPTGRIVEQAYRPTVSEVGRRHPVTRDLPGSPVDASGTPSWGRWFRLIDAEVEKGHVVMNGPADKPLLVLDRVGEGRVALLLSDHAWLWARGLEGGGPHTTLLRRLAHWLMKEPDLEEEYLGASARGLTISIERRTMGDETGPVTLTAPDGTTIETRLEEASPGLWRGDVEVELPGLYQIAADGLSSVAHAGAANSREMMEVTASAAPLSPMLELTGGGALWPVADDGDLTMPRVSLLQSARLMHGASWIGLRDRNAYVTRGVRLIPLYAGFIALAALIALVSLMWWREGR